jgi:hypothetical protein
MEFINKADTGDTLINLEISWSVQIKMHALAPGIILAILS